MGRIFGRVFYLFMFRIACVRNTYNIYIGKFVFFMFHVYCNFTSNP